MQSILSWRNAEVGQPIPERGPVTETVAPSLLELLPEAAITLGGQARDWRAAVRLAGAALARSGATTPEYASEMIATVEQLGPYIVIAPGIALAHSRPSPAVLRTGLSWVALAEPVAFGHPENDPVSLVVGLAARDESGHIDALAILADLLSDDALRTELLSSTTASAVRAAIARHEKEGSSNRAT